MLLNVLAFGHYIEALCTLYCTRLATIYSSNCKQYFTTHPPQHAQPKHRKYTETAQLSVIKYKAQKHTINKNKKVQSLNDKLKRSTIIEAKTTTPLDPRYPQTHAGRAHRSKQ